MIDLQPNEDQQLIVDSVVAFIASELPVQRLNPKEQRHDADSTAWPKMADLGWFGLLLSEEAGGMDLGNAEGALVFEHFGRHLLTPTVLASVIAARLAGQDLALAQSIAAGERRAALATISEWSAEAQAAQLLVVDGADADLLLLFSADGALELRQRSPASAASEPTLDTWWTLERLPLSGTTALVREPAGSATALAATLLFAASLSGMAAATRDLSVEYAKIREQFGKPIGAFQAVKHACADLAIRAEAARAQTVFAAVALDQAHPEAEREVAAALVIAASAALQNAAATIQLHGGVGFTAECNAHHYLKRATLFERLAGGIRPHQNTLVAAGPQSPQ